jgi:hypothetical protein
MHWDPNTGRPDRRHLVELGLPEVARALFGEASAPPRSAEI